MWTGGFASEHQIRQTTSTVDPVACRASMAMHLRGIVEGIGLIDLYPHCATLDHLEQVIGCGEQFGSRARVSCGRGGRVTNKEPLPTKAKIERPEEDFGEAW